MADLQHHLAGLFPLKEEILHIAAKAGLPPSTLTVADKGIVFWYNVIEEARRKHRIAALVDEARRLYPEDAWLAAFDSDLDDETNGVAPDMIKALCIDLIEEGQYGQVWPLLEQLTAPAANPDLEEQLLQSMAQIQRHIQDSLDHTGRRQARAQRFAARGRADLMARIEAL